MTGQLTVKLAAIICQLVIAFNDNFTEDTERMQ